MKTLLYTGWDEAYKPLAMLTVPRMAEYAKLRGMDFVHHTKPLIEIPNGIYWTGVCGALWAFQKGYDAVMYLDVDQLITNPDFAWPPMTRGVHVSKDWGDDATEDEHFSACGFIAFNDDDSLRFFRSVRLMAGAANSGSFPEQNEMRAVYKYQKEYGHNWVTVHPRKVFNCVPEAICSGAPEPWKLGDFAAHLTMVDLPRRIEVANLIMPSLWR